MKKMQRTIYIKADTTGKAFLAVQDALKKSGMDLIDYSISSIDHLPLNKQWVIIQGNGSNKYQMEVEVVK